MLRGALGHALRRTACSCGGTHRAECAYARIFEPESSGTGPSGLADRPRPFVFRVAHLDGQTIPAGECFSLDINLFEVPNPPIEYFTRAFECIAQEGLGPDRASLELLSVEPVDSRGQVAAPNQPISLSLHPLPGNRGSVRVDFVTPTELKGTDHPQFGVLFARIRDRISTLRALYGPGPLSIDFRAIGERASIVQMVHSELREVYAARRSSRTGQSHPIGGFAGIAEYEGSLAEFVPYLEAARWTGVGRHCVWGQGELHVRTTPGQV